MLKSKNKRNAVAKSLINFQNKITNKIVGADASVRPNSKGITLIALIITIIVMLILVAVTINVALDTGLFGTAKKSAYQTEVSTIKEQLEIAKATKVAENGGEEPTNYELTLNDLNISDELKSKYGSKLLISKDGTLYYEGDAVTDEEKLALEDVGIDKYDEDLEILKDYFLGENRDGKNLMNLVETEENPYNFTYKDDPNTLEDETELANNINSSGAAVIDIKTLNNEAYFIINCYIKYNNKVYAVRVRSSNEPHPENLTESVEYKYTPQGLEGQDLGEVTGEEKYKGWTILYDNLNGTVEAISPEAMGSLTLGSDNIEEAIDSYNNVMETINDYCKEQITDDIATDENVRSVGAKEDPRPNLKENNVYNGIPREWPNNIADKYNGKLKLGDTMYEQDVVRMNCFGITNTGDMYWMASRHILFNEEWLLAGVGFFYESLFYAIEPMYCWFVIDPYNNGVVSGEFSAAVRPIIRIQIQ